MKPKAVALAALLALGTPGCIFANGSGTSGETSGGTTTDADIKQYESLRTQLEAHRKPFLPVGASELQGVATRVFWEQFPTDSPDLYSYEPSSDTRTKYDFSIGVSDDANFRASEDLVVTAENTGDHIVYHTYAAGAANQSLGDLETDPTGDDVKWWAYAPDHGDLYYVVTGDDTALWKWTPKAGGDATRLFSLEELGLEPGEFEDFGVDSGVMVFIEGGRIWSLDLATKKPVWLGNKTEASGAAWDQQGVLFSTADGPFFYDYSKGSLRDLAAEIQGSSYKLNTTYASAHLYSDDLTRKGSLFGYKGSSGVFTYDLDGGAVTPILLDARDLSTYYRYPVILDEGSFFVVGLESNDGAIGADGQTYTLDYQL